MIGQYTNETSADSIHFRDYPGIGTTEREDIVPVMVDAHSLTSGFYGSRKVASDYISGRYSGTEEEYNLLVTVTSASAATWLFSGINIQSHPVNRSLSRFRETSRYIEANEYFESSTSVPGESTDLRQRLEAVAAMRNERAFIMAINSIDWRCQPPEEFIHAIQLALSAGAHIKARMLAQQGAENFPGHIKLQKFARILAPPKIIKSNFPPDPTLRGNGDWLIANGDKYRGRWVALRAGELLGVAPTLTELIEQIGNPKDRRILVTQV